MAVCLNGIDAPELHYRPAALASQSKQNNEQHRRYLDWNYEYRQPRGETAVIGLSQRLGGMPSRLASVRSPSQRGNPNDPFVCYRRLVGDLFH
ncbi:MAG TPA: hypothetical protein VIV60_37570 [Polyangiaceae bacterium]